jgi:signal transduction histidine kinase
MPEPRRAPLPGPAWPLAVAAVLVAALFCLRPLGLANATFNSAITIPLLCCPFLVAYALGYAAGLAAGLIAVGALVAGLQVAGGPFSPLVEMITIGPWIAGRIVGSRRRLAGQLRARNAELAAQQEAYAAEAVRYERSRIAAELHDLVGHALSLMVVQAGAGQRAACLTGEDGARTALELVAQAAREAQAELAPLARRPPLSRPLARRRAGAAGSTWSRTWCGRCGPPGLT